MFLFTSEDGVLDRYLREHWAALDGLSGEWCDIHVSLFQLNGAEDFYSQFEEVRSISGLQSIGPSDLPALHVWSEAASVTIPLRACDTDAKLRDLLRSIFSTIRAANGPVSSQITSSLREAATVNATDWQALANRQGIHGSSAGGDIVQIIQVHHSSEEPRMIDKPETRDNGRPPANRAEESAPSQVIEDVNAGSGISQVSDSPSDSQAVRRAVTTGAVTQKKSAKSEMEFGWGRARGLGIIGLVLVFVAWLAYKYFSHS